MKVCVTVYADDTTITVAADSPHELEFKANSVMLELAVWCDKNRLVLNIEKTVAVNFNIRRPLCLNSYGFSFASDVKFLGTHLELTLQFDKHIDFVCKQLNGCYYAILKLRGCLDEARLLDMYYALVYS